MPSDGEPLLRTEANHHALDAVHACLHAFWHSVRDMTDDDRMRFDLAVAEVAANIVGHSVVPVVMTLDLRQLDGGGVEAVIDDDGPELPDDVIVSATDPDAMAESGRGLTMAKAALDEFTYSRADGRNHWHLVRRPH